MQNITLIHGECLKEMDKLIKQNIKVDAIITDEPYGTTQCKWDEAIPFADMWKRLKLLKQDEHTPILLFGSEPFSSRLRLSNLKEYRYDWKWNKTVAGNPLNAKYRPLSVFEDIIVFSKARPNYFPIMERAKPKNVRPIGISKKKTDLLNEFKSGKYIPQKDYDPNVRYPKNEIIISSRMGECNPHNRLHPTQKPIVLIEYLIKTYTKENDLVLDFTMGSGTTGVACKSLNRRFIGIEKEQKYYDIAVKRLKIQIKELANE